jgi:hypothetical protein
MAVTLNCTDVQELVNNLDDRQQDLALVTPTPARRAARGEERARDEPSAYEAHSNQESPHTLSRMFNSRTNVSGASPLRSHQVPQAFINTKNTHENEATLHGGSHPRRPVGPNPGSAQTGGAATASPSAPRQGQKETRPVVSKPDMSTILSKYVRRQPRYKC